LQSSLSDRVRVVESDITTLDVDVIVNAANSPLLDGGGVDWAIHRVARPALLDECRQFGGCPTGQARITTGHRLRAKHVIHPVEPVYRGGERGEPDLIHSCHELSLRLALGKEAETIAFPCVPTGVHADPKDAACRIAVDTVVTWLKQSGSPYEVLFCCFGSEEGDLYRAYLGDKVAPA